MGIKIVEDAVLSEKIIKEINKSLNKPIKIMEVCGTHTNSIYKYGIDTVLEDKINLISGPGCPVCVTEKGYIDAALSLAENNIIIASFGDMMRVPGSDGSLISEKKYSKNIKLIYSPDELFKICKDNWKKEVVFLAVGFETIAPIYADIILRAKKLKVKNLSFLSSIKRMPPVIDYLLKDKNVQIDGLICPGHVCSVIGINDFEKLSKVYNIPMVVSGFNSVEILASILKLVKMINYNEFKAINYYSSVVSKTGNMIAIKKIDEVFEVFDDYWRGIGKIKCSGYKINKKYEDFDASEKFKLKIVHKEDTKQCLCGDIIKGYSKPIDCKAFGKICTPSNPLGPCMVSAEGTCSNYYKYHMRRK